MADPLYVIHPHYAHKQDAGHAAHPGFENCEDPSHYEPPDLNSAKLAVAPEGDRPAPDARSEVRVKGSE